MLLDISIVPQTSEELFYFVTKRIPYLCGFWRFANAYWNEYGKELRGKDEELQRALAREAENRIKLVIDTLRELDLPKEQITAMLMKKCGLDREETAKRVEL